MKRVSVGVLPILVLASCTSATDGSAGDGNPLADIRADSNRDGAVRFDDESDARKTVWDATGGAIFLANIDDDLERCDKDADDVDLAACNDAADEVVDGPDDLADLARIETKPWPSAPRDAKATIQIVEGDPAHVRLFKRDRTKPNPAPEAFTVHRSGDELDADDVRAGIELAIEATDIVRDRDVWDGYVVLEYTVTAGGKAATDRVKLRVAPVLTAHHLLPAERIYVSNTGDIPNLLMRTDLDRACEQAGVPAPVDLPTPDQWTQDLFETAYMSMPGNGGVQHVVRVVYRSANVDAPDDEKNPLRVSSKVVFSQMRGKDVAGVQQYDVGHDPSMDSLDSLGNLETIPPYSMGDRSFPFGRVLRGRTDAVFPDPSFDKMIEAQGQQPPIYVDTSWLWVGHVDETISFVKASSPRGWVVIVNDPTLAKKMLEDEADKGHETVPMFVGLSWYDGYGGASPAETTIADVLADTDVMQASARAAVAIDGQIAKLEAETGVTDAEIVRIPFLHMTTEGRSLAYQPATVNGLYVADGHFVAPDPHGPEIDGKDIFRTQMEEALAPFGITVHFVEDWDEYHAVEGEVHCGTNVERKVPDAKWWESAR